MKILSVRQGFASDHSSTSYEFLAVDKPLSKKERAEVSLLSRRVNPTARRASFVYHVDGYDIPGGWDKLMKRYYDVMYSESYGWWMLVMAVNAAPGQYEKLLPYKFDGVHEGMGIDISGNKHRVIIMLHCSVEFDGTDSDYDDGEEYVENDIENDNENKEFETGDELLNILIQIRRQIIAGDYRALYTVWEKYGDLNDENPPPKPKSREKGMETLKSFKNMLSYIE